MTASTDGKLTFREKCGYASSSIGDALVYTLICTFMMYFLTDIVGIAPGAAGTITAVGTVWDALVNPFIGYVADNVRSRYGRRRPMMLGCGAAMCMVVVLLFTKVDLPSGYLEVYYGVMLMIYWTFYTGFFVPNTALGALYTTDYNERSVIRFFASVFNMFGSVVSMLAPTLLVRYLTGSRGVTLEHAWTATAILAAAVTFVSILVTFADSKDKDLACIKAEGEKVPGFSPGKIILSYCEVARLRPMKYLIAASVCSLICYTMIMSDMVYFFTYNMGFGAGRTSVFLSLRSISAMFIIPAIAWAMARIDKQWTMIAFDAVAIAGMFLLRVIGITGTGMTVIYIVMVALCTCVYWALMPSIYYDMCDYDRAVNGADRQGMIISFSGLVESLSAGIGTFMLGMVLQTAGFDGTADVQTEPAKTWIFNCTTVLPVIFLGLACVAIKLYPVNRKVYREIIERAKDPAE